MINNHELDKSLKTLTVIWGAMIVSVLAYLFVIPHYLGGNNVAFLPPDAFRMLRIALYVVSLGTILGARFVSKYILSGKANSSPNTKMTAHPALQIYTTAMIISLALSESIAVYGLVLFIMGRDAMSLYILCSISIFSMFMYRPTRQDIIDAAVNLEKLARGAGIRS